MRNDFKLKFIREEFTPHNKFESQSILESFHLKRFLLRWIHDFAEKRHKFSHISDMNFTTIDPIKKMFCKFYLKKPEWMLEVTLSRKFDENPIS